MASKGPLYLGFDLSTQQLKALVVDQDLTLRHEAKVSFDDDLPRHGTAKGVLTNPVEGEIFAPVAMWLDAIELVLSRLRQEGCDFSRIEGLSGAGMQHGTVFWSSQAEKFLAALDPSRTLTEQLEPSTEVDDRRGAFSHPHSPNWQDASTQKQCEAFDAELGSPEVLAQETGSGAHHRFSGPQIMRWSQKYPSEWKKTARISLVSSFISTVFLGKFAPIDIGDVCGMNLWHIAEGEWHPKLLELVAGKEHVPELKAKLGEVPEDGGGTFGPISSYFTKRYGFPSDCAVIPATGDNPATILALPLRPCDAMVSLGTSTTFLMSTPAYKPNPAYHFMNHPTTPGLYMFMLCYKNGGLAREQIRDRLDPGKSWDKFNQLALDTPPLSQKSGDKDMRMGLFFPRPEIVPNVREGEWRYSYDPLSDTVSELQGDFGEGDARTIVESQMLSLRLRSQGLVEEQRSADGAKLPAQPRRVYLVGGASSNPAIARIAGDVLGGAEGVFKLDIGGNACALGAAYKATWGCQRAHGQSFEDYISARWDEDKFVVRVTDGYRPGVFEKYGDALKGFETMERQVIDAHGHESGETETGGRFYEPKNSD